ncbi:hypothetical protein Ahy_B05g079406 isoform B [Arachis hypogaea]|uniref:HVA22-like protein n=1 Tax=Arachis hypogaea TaxID=3818 RepID=A0A444Z9R7_ARAHY|nr:hypothetical protein Ahy_B05g079406 isoform B [Arachis hypogaea]
MALLGSNLTGEVGLRLLLCPLGSNIVIRTACCSVGIALPVYSTFKAIESRDQNAQRKCLLYWAAYGSFSLVEVFTDKLIYWFPMYYHIKFAFLVWLQLPSTDDIHPLNINVSLMPNSRNSDKLVLQQGAKQLYMKHLRPFLSRHQAKVDQILGIASCEVEESSEDPVSNVLVNKENKNAVFRVEFVLWLQIKLVSSYQAEIQFVRSMVVKISGSADHMLGGATESDRSRQPNPSEDPAVPSDAEPDQNNN